MSPSNSAQLRHAPAVLTAKAMRLSASLTAHLRTIERKIPLHARYENFIGGKWIAPVKGGYFDKHLAHDRTRNLPDRPLAGGRR